jgi:pantoate--beta-alanine ligase
MEEIAAGLRAGRAMSALYPAAAAKLEQAGFTGIDYLELRDASDLELMEQADRPSRLFAAAWLAGVRLIDNIAV